MRHRVRISVVLGVVALLATACAPRFFYEGRPDGGMRMKVVDLSACNGLVGEEKCVGVLQPVAAAEAIAACGGTSARVDGCSKDYWSWGWIGVECDVHCGAPLPITSPAQAAAASPVTRQDR